MVVGDEFDCKCYGEDGEVEGECDVCYVDCVGDGGFCGEYCCVVIVEYELECFDCFCC